MIPILYGGQGDKEDPGGAALLSQPGGQLEGDLRIKVFPVPKFAWRPTFRLPDCMTSSCCRLQINRVLRLLR